MDANYKIVSECLLQIEASGLNPLKRMRLEMQFYRLKRMLLSEQILDQVCNDDFTTLVTMTRQVGETPDSKDVLSKLESHLTVMNAALEPRVGGQSLVEQ
jgi:hypothetical protein